MKNDAPTESDPIAHIALEDPACRDAVVDTLHRRGWSVIEHRTGLHLIHAISGLILGDQPSRRPQLIVADAAARGCSGLSIARGLRDLGSRIPVIVVARAADELAAAQSGPLTIVAPENAARTVALLARPHRPRRGNPSSQQSASA
jgi:FixJ family two-component response regulator